MATGRKSSMDILKYLMISLVTYGETIAKPSSGKMTLGTCPKGWIYAPISNKCLIISPTFPIVDGARIDCKNAGGDLAQFASLKELKEAVLLLKPIKHDHLVGVIQQKEYDCNSYATFGGRSIPFNSSMWYKTPTYVEPFECKTSGIHCVIIYEGYYFDKPPADCSSLFLNYICEKTK